MAGHRIVPFGDAAVLVELDVVGSVEAARAARALAAAIVARGADEPALGVPVPAASSVLVSFDPLALDPGLLAELIAGVLAGPAAMHPPEPPAGTLHRIPVRYGGEDGPDLAAVAAELGLSTGEVVDLHAGTDLEVLFLGFAPGFAYLGELPAALQVPRLATPRVRVPAGSVAIAGTMSAIYPHASPGGWRILGRTDAALWNPAATPPARLRPGDRVRFEPA
jgi:KipI family sensor histidine kinase inhibitor